jgi:hypothetical protein
VSADATQRALAAGPGKLIPLLGRDRSGHPDDKDPRAVGVVQILREHAGYRAHVIQRDQCVADEQHTRRHCGHERLPPGQGIRAERRHREKLEDAAARMSSGLDSQARGADAPRAATAPTSSANTASSTCPRSTPSIAAGEHTARATTGALAQREATEQDPGGSEEQGNERKPQRHGPCLVHADEGEEQHGRCTVRMPTARLVRRASMVRRHQARGHGPSGLRRICPSRAIDHGPNRYPFPVLRRVR